MRQSIRVCLLLFSFSVLLPGCFWADGYGGEGEPCFGNGTCNPGHVCDIDICIKRKPSTDGDSTPECSDGETDCAETWTRLCQDGRWIRVTDCYNLDRVCENGRCVRPVSDGDGSDGDTSDGDNPDGDAPDGDTPDGDNPDGDAPDGDIPDGDTDAEEDGDQEAEPCSLCVSPDPLDFGQVVVGQTGVLGIEISNQTGGSVSVTGIRTVGEGCQEFDLYLGQHGDFPFTLGAGESIADIGASYTPTDGNLDTDCQFLVIYKQQGQTQYRHVNMAGSGRVENRKPVAKVALSADGPDILEPIEIPPTATELQKRFTLYGDISTDPEGNYPLTYLWTLQKPAESETSVWPSFQDAVITVELDHPGPYTLTLVVKDSKNAESDPKHVLLNLATDRKITIDMTFTGSGAMNVDLTWVSPTGSLCNQSTMTTERLCQFGAYGIPFVANYTTQARNGTRETIVHPNPPDGRYSIQVAFKESCSGWELLTVCMDERGTNITVQIYVDMETEPRYTLNHSFTSSQKGQIKAWFVDKLAETWSEPTD